MIESPNRLSQLSVSGRWRRARRVLTMLALLLAYIGITVKMTDPAYSRLADGIIGCCDAPMHGWAYWWTRYALLELGQSPWSTNYLFHPQELGTIALSGFVHYNSVISVPLQLLFGVNAAVNLLALASFVLSGIGTFMLIRHETGHPLAAFVASLIYAYAPPLFARLSVGHYHTIAIWPTPFIILAWLIALRHDNHRAAAISGGLLGIQWSINPYQGSYVMILMASLGIALVLKRWRSPDRKPLVGIALLRSLGFAALALIVVLLPHAVGVIGDLRSGQSARVPLSAANNFAPDLLAYLIPSPFHPLLKETFESINRKIGSLDPVRVVFPGYLALSLGFAAAVRALSRRSDRHAIGLWLIGLITMFVLSLGPLLHVYGQTQFEVSDITFTVPLPFILLWHVPILGEGRTTANMCFTISLCLAVLSGFTLAALFRRFPHRPITLLISLVFAAGVLYEGLAAPLSVPTLRVSPFYERVAAEPGEFALLEVPVGWRDGRIGLGQLHTDHLYYATVHHKPLVNGYASRVPDEYFEFFASKKALGFLVNPNEPPPPEAQDRDLVLQTLRELNVRYVILHRSEKQTEVAAYLGGVVGLPQIYHDDQLQVFRVE